MKLNKPSIFEKANTRKFQTFLIVNSFLSLPSSSVLEESYDIFTLKFIPDSYHIILKIFLNNINDKCIKITYGYCIYDKNKKKYCCRKQNEAITLTPSLNNFDMLFCKVSDATKHLSDGNLILLIYLEYQNKADKNILRNQIKLNERPVIPFKGIINCSSKCFMNVCLQLFFHIAPIRQLIYKLPDISFYPQIKIVFCWLQNCFSHANIKNLINSLPSNILDSDFCTFFQFLLQKFEKQDKSIREFFEFSINTGYSLLKNTFFELEVLNNKSLEDFLDEFYQNNKFCSLPSIFLIHTDRISYQNRKITKVENELNFPSKISMEKYVESSPSNYIINNDDSISSNYSNTNTNKNINSNANTNRSSSFNNNMNSQTHNNKELTNLNGNNKISTNFNNEFNNTFIKIDDASNDNYSDKNEVLNNRNENNANSNDNNSVKNNNISNESDYLYTLYSVICHNGNPLSGHYYLYIKCIGKNWVLFDDQKVSFVSEHEVIRERCKGQNSTVLLVYVKSQIKDKIETADISNSKIVPKMSDSEYSDQIKKSYLETKEKIQKEEDIKNSLVIRYFRSSDLDKRCDRALKVRSQSMPQFLIPSRNQVQDLFQVISTECNSKIDSFRIWMCDERDLIPTMLVRSSLLKSSLNCLLQKTLFIEETASSDLTDESILLIVKYFDNKTVELVKITSMNINDPISKVESMVKEVKKLDDDEKLIVFAESKNQVFKLKVKNSLKSQGVHLSGTVLIFQKKSASQESLEFISNEFDSSSFFVKQQRNTVKNYIDRKYNMSQIGFTFNKQSKTLKFPKSMSLPDLSKFISHSFKIRCNENDKLLFFNNNNLALFKAKNVEDLCKNSPSYMLAVSHSSVDEPIAVFAYEGSRFIENTVIFTKSNPTKREIIGCLVRANSWPTKNVKISGNEDCEKNCKMCRNENGYDCNLKNGVDGANNNNSDFYDSNGTKNDISNNSNCNIVADRNSNNGSCSNCDFNNNDDVKNDISNNSNNNIVADRNSNNGSCSNCDFNNNDDAKNDISNNSNCNSMNDRNSNNSSCSNCDFNNNDDAKNDISNNSNCNIVADKNSNNNDSSSSIATKNSSTSSGNFSSNFDNNDINCDNDDALSQYRVYAIDFGSILIELNNNDQLDSRFNQVVVLKDAKNGKFCEENFVNIKFVDEENHHIKSRFFFRIIKDELFVNTLQRMKDIIGSDDDSYDFILESANKEKMISESSEVFSMIESKNDFILAIQKVKKAM